MKDYVIKEGDIITIKWKHFGEQDDIIQTKEIISKKNFEKLKGTKGFQSWIYIVEGSPVHEECCCLGPIGYVKTKIADTIYTNCVERIKIEPRTELKEWKDKKVKHKKNGEIGIVKMVMKGVNKSIGNIKTYFVDQLYVWPNITEYGWCDIDEIELIIPKKNSMKKKKLTKHQSSVIRNKNFKRLKKLKQQYAPLPLKSKHKKWNCVIGTGWYKGIIGDSYINEKLYHFFIEAKNERQALNKSYKIYGIDKKIYIDEDRMSRSWINATKHKCHSILRPKQIINKKLFSIEEKIKEIENHNNMIKLKIVYIESNLTKHIFKVPKYKADDYTTKWFISVPPFKWKRQLGNERAERKTITEKNRKVGDGQRIYRRIDNGKRNMPTKGRIQFIPIKEKKYRTTILDQIPTFKLKKDVKQIKEKYFNIVTNNEAERILKVSNKTDFIIDEKKYIRIGYETVKKEVDRPEKTTYKKIIHNDLYKQKSTNPDKISIEKVVESMNPIKGAFGWGSIFKQEIDKNKKRRKRLALNRIKKIRNYSKQTRNLIKNKRGE